MFHLELGFVALARILALRLIEIRLYLGSLANALPGGGGLPELLPADGT